MLARQVLYPMSHASNKFYFISKLEYYLALKKEQSGLGM
jgi:hypothetical protein